MRTRNDIAGVLGVHAQVHRDGLMHTLKGRRTTTEAFDGIAAALAAAVGEYNGTCTKARMRLNKGLDISGVEEAEREAEVALRREIETLNSTRVAMLKSQASKLHADLLALGKRRTPPKTDADRHEAVLRAHEIRTSRQARTPLENAIWFESATEEAQAALIDAPVALLSLEFVEQVVAERSKKASPGEWEALEELRAVAGASEMLVNAVRASIGVDENQPMLEVVCEVA